MQTGKGMASINRVFVEKSTKVEVADEGRQVAKDSYGMCQYVLRQTIQAYSAG